MDIHKEAAKKMYGVEEPTPEQRRIAKILSFGEVYGTGNFGGLMKSVKPPLRKRLWHKLLRWARRNHGNG